MVHTVGMVNCYSDTSGPTAPPPAVGGGAITPGSLSKELSNLEAASRISTELVVGALSGLKGDLAVVANELKVAKTSGGYSEEAVKNMEELARRLESEVEKLTEEWTSVETELVEVRRWFGEDVRRSSSFEEFVTAVRTFVAGFVAVEAEMRRKSRPLTKMK